jgi:alkyl sulfatase BDS1-like metallo-beta-lactamase superfamily hydrolase
MPPEMLFDYLGVRLNGPKAAGKTIKIFTDIGKQYSLVVENGVLNYADKLVDAPDQADAD